LYPNSNAQSYYGNLPLISFTLQCFNAVNWVTRKVKSPASDSTIPSFGEPDYTGVTPQNQLLKQKVKSCFPASSIYETAMAIMV